MLYKTVYIKHNLQDETKILLVINTHAHDTNTAQFLKAVNPSRSA